jgi:hypothetical protein
MYEQCVRYLIHLACGFLFIVDWVLLNARHAPKGDSIQEAQGRLSSRGTSAVHLCQPILHRY